MIPRMEKIGNVEEKPDPTEHQVSHHGNAGGVPQNVVIQPRLVVADAVALPVEVV